MCAVIYLSGSSRTKIVNAPGFGFRAKLARNSSRSRSMNNFNIRLPRNSFLANHVNDPRLKTPKTSSPKKPPQSNPKQIQVFPNRSKSNSLCGARMLQYVALLVRLVALFGLICFEVGAISEFKHTWVAFGPSQSQLRTGTLSLKGLIFEGFGPKDPII